MPRYSIVCLTLQDPWQNKLTTQKCTHGLQTDGAWNREYELVSHALVSRHSNAFSTAHVAGTLFLQGHSQGVRLVSHVIKYNHYITVPYKAVQLYSIAQLNRHVIQDVTHVSMPGSYA